jgi:hypothetical protein
VRKRRRIGGKMRASTAVPFPVPYSISKKFHS